MTTNPDTKAGAVAPTPEYTFLPASGDGDGERFYDGDERRIAPTAIVKALSQRDALAAGAEGFWRAERCHREEVARCNASDTMLAARIAGLERQLARCEDAGRHAEALAAALADLIANGDDSRIKSHAALAAYLALVAQDGAK